ncbi:MAG TPA: phosphatidylglycerophosphatase A [Terriglobales bacterium]|nr:phosphatidylglycerophosphatase A [Terriglobales bacterium]
MPEAGGPPRTTWAWLVATFFGVGFLRPAPGTWGSAVGLLVWWLAARYLTGAEWHWLAASVAAALLVVVGIPAATIVERESGGTDPSHIVIDEVAGQLIALVAVPLRWQYLILSFILFRSFDTLKPSPCRRLQNLHGGAGVVLDDVGAGLYTLVIMQVLVHLQLVG